MRTTKCRKVKTLRGSDLCLEWNNVASILRWRTVELPPYQYTLKNLILFRGYLREFCRDTYKAIDCEDLVPRLVTKRVNIVTHAHALNTSIRFISKNSTYGYLTTETVKIMLNRIADSIIVLSESTLQKKIKLQVMKILNEQGTIAARKVIDAAIANGADENKYHKAWDEAWAMLTAKLKIKLEVSK